MDDYESKENPKIYSFKVANYLKNKEIFGEQFMEVRGVR